MTTHLAYLDDDQNLTLEASLTEIVDDASGPVLILDVTPFYPQGGGQPSDIGTIVAPTFSFQVSKARLQDGVVLHGGTVVSGQPEPGTITAEVDPAPRTAHAKLHSGGHLIMTAMYELTGARAQKGYHFPQGPYVEFEGVVPETERSALQASMQDRLDAMVEADEPITAQFTTLERLQEQGVYVPTELPVDKPTRVVTTFDYVSPCGGTHVSSSGVLRGLKVRAIKAKSGVTRVSYLIDG